MKTTDLIVIRPANELFSAGHVYVFTVSHEGDDFENFLSGHPSIEDALKAAAKYAVELSCPILDMTAPPI